MKILLLTVHAMLLFACTTMTAQGPVAVAALDPTRGNTAGDPASVDHHAGDMPMLMADASGNASLSVELESATVGGGAGDVVRKAVIVRKDADDYKTQPTGNSGARVACGIIRRR